MLNACCDIWSQQGKKMLIIFGGRRPNRSCSNELIAINLDTFTWFFLRVSGGSPKASEGACMVIIDNRLHIFGGIHDEDTHMASFSVAEYHTADAFTNEPSGWRWLFCDKPYPSYVARGPWHALDALHVYDKRKILLIAGRQVSNARKNLVSHLCAYP